MLRAARLRCEYLTNPIGVDVPRPRLSWIVESDRAGTRQCEYRIRAGSSPGTSDLWDTGPVASNRTTHIEWDGLRLTSALRVFWEVSITDDAGTSATSDPATFEVGLLYPEDWALDGNISPPDAPAQMAWWITNPQPANGTRPCPMLRREFDLTSEVRTARAYVSARGLYLIYVNGQRVGDRELAPGWTDYAKRQPYDTYDVAPLLRQGHNAVAMVVADGWYSGQVGFVGSNVYGQWPSGLCMIRCEHADGSVTGVVSDSSWKATFGPWLDADLLRGETYDARLEHDGWTSPGFDASGWSSAVEVGPAGPVLKARRNEPVRTVKTLVAHRVTSAPNGGRIFDFGQNLTGRVRLIASGARGVRMTVRHAEMLDADGGIYTANLRDAACTDHYTLRGDGPESFEPSFTFHGFRYAEVTGDVEVSYVSAVVIGSDTQRHGEFECSNELINRLQANIWWGQRSNFLEVPTDCPQRDERLGWLGDAQIFAWTSCFNADTAAFFTKWMDDVTDAQTVDGAFPDVAPVTRPANLEMRSGAPGWADAGVIVPWTVWRWYGDTRILSDHWVSMKRFVDYVHDANPDLLWTQRRGNNFGEWLAVGADTPKDVMSTAFFCHSTRLLSKIATALGRTDDAVQYCALADRIALAFQNQFADADTRIHGDTQACYVLALAFGLLDDAQQQRAAQHLVDRIADADGHLSTGFLAVGHLLPVLTEAGHLDVAYALLEQTTYPSWLYPVLQGATTIWERWDGWTHDRGFQNPFMNSFNHYSFGSVGQWLYSTVGGISEIEPGFSRSLIAPRPGGSITSARAAFDSMQGRISCWWGMSGSELSMEVVVPSNTEARIVVPSGDAVCAEGLTAGGGDDHSTTFEVEGGTWSFSGPREP